MDLADRVRHKAPKYSAVPEVYRARMQVGFGLWLDNQSTARPWSTTDFARNHFSPQGLTTALQTALEVRDRYVWLYSHTPRFFPRSELPEAYLQAIEKARAVR